MGVTSCATLPFLPGTHVFSTVFKLLQANSTLFKHLWLVTIGKDIIPVLDYYESRNAVELTKKIQSIPAFHGVKAPMTRRKQGWIPDFSSRYFTEDVPLGTKPICCLAEQLNIPVPTLQSFVEWNTSILNRFSPFQKKQ